MRRIYLDYNATTPIAPEVCSAIQPFLAEHYGNPSSSHSLGRACSEAIADSRERVANLICAEPDEVIFTGGGTESNNLALKGIFLGETSFLSGHLIISSIEHPATSVPAAYLQKHGVDVTVVPCDRQGFIDPEEVRKAIRPETRLVSIMLANNEVGSLQPMQEIAQICRERNVLTHTDAAQAVGKVPVNVKVLGVDMLSIAGHKLYAPKGIGAFFCRDSVDLTPLLHGASHEFGLRAGTENTPYIVGLGQAAKSAAQRLEDEAFHRESRDMLCNALSESLADHIVLNTDLDACLPNTLSVSFKGIVGNELLAAIPEICASTGAACHSGSTSMSATLAAMGVSNEQALGTVRLSTGIFTTEEEIQIAAERLVDSYRSLAM